MRITNKDGNVVTLSVEDLFMKVSAAWRTNPMSEKGQIYQMADTANEVSYRVILTTGDTFEVTRHDASETVRLHNDNWVTVSGPRYEYCGITKTFAGCPRVTLDKAHEIFNGK